jgi:nitric oxide synthase oxygenase domain/subunit/sulfite reductase alpha subunit-like flavoprotein
MMNKKGSPNDVPSLNLDEDVDPKTVLVEATDFLRLYYKENKGIPLLQSLTDRLKDVQQEIAETGTYTHTYEELAYGCKVSWRNASRCINRIQWQNMDVMDRRDLDPSDTKGCFDLLLDHMRYCVSGATVQTTISIFPPKKPGESPLRIWNPQILGYAGYHCEGEDGESSGVVGDPANMELTDELKRLGWKGAGGAFDLLPIAIQAGGGTAAGAQADVELYELPADIKKLQVGLKHERYPGIAELHMRWSSVPVLSAFVLDIGGVLYPCCPFNGWFMETEIARDLGDVQRYNFLPAIAEKMGLNTKANASLWRDEAQVALCQAILQSYTAAQVSIVDHHSASDGFMRFMKKEMKLRGGVPGDWIWITPPVGGSTTAVFHQEMLNYQLKPMYRQITFAWEKYDWDAYAERQNTKLLRKQDLLPSSGHICVVFGSESGKAEDYAYRLKALLSKAVVSKPNYKVSICEGNELDAELLESGGTQHLVVVTSTCGNGDSPSNAAALLEKLRARLATTATTQAGDDQPLHPIHFAVLGLGSTAYPLFNACGRAFEEVLTKLGGKLTIPSAWADEIEGEENTFDEFATALLDEIFRNVVEPTKAEPTKAKASSSTTAATSGGGDGVEDEAAAAVAGWTIKEASAEEAKALEAKATCLTTKEEAASCPAFGRKRPAVCRVVANTNPLAAAATWSSDNSEDEDEDDPNTLLYTNVAVDMKAVGGTFAPGDHLYVVPTNPESAVAMMCRKLGLDENAAFVLDGLSEEKQRPAPKRLQTPVTYGDAFAKYLDILAVPSCSCLKFLSTVVSDEKERDTLEQLSEAGNGYDEWAHTFTYSLVDTLVKMCHSAKFNLQRRRCRKPP